MIYYTLPSNQLFIDIIGYHNNTIPKTFVDNAIVKLSYTKTGESKRALVVDFGKHVIVKHMSIIGEKIIHPVLPQWGLLDYVCASYTDGITKKYNIPKIYPTRKEKKELSKPQICVKPTKPEHKLISPIKQFKLSYKNKQGKWVMLKIYTAPDRFEVMIDLSQYTCLNTRYLKIEPLNYMSSPTLKINYLFYGIEQTIKHSQWNK